MHIGWIQLLEFRNYRTLSWSPSPKLNLLTGPNAQGKTNILEALGFLITGRSFRTARLAEIPHWGAESAAVAGELRRADGARNVRRAIDRHETGRWQGRGDGCAWARAVAFGWQDLEILAGPPAARRNFLDGFAARLYPGHRPALARFRQVLDRRNHLLQRGLAERLEPWDRQFAEIGAELVDRRRRAAAALATELARVYAALAGGRAKVDIHYRSSTGESSDARTLLGMLEGARAQELRRRRTLVGPHRDDLMIELDGVDARVFGSRGQQRLLALALRLAEVLPITEAVGTAPVLLLDDALSELDSSVRRSVLHEIEAAEQVFLTAPDPLAAPGAARWSVEGGGIAAA